MSDDEPLTFPRLSRYERVTNGGVTEALTVLIALGTVPNDAGVFSFKEEIVQENRFRRR